LGWKEGTELDLETKKGVAILKAKET
jgi:hypothetical protein